MDSDEKVKKANVMVFAPERVGPTAPATRIETRNSKIEKTLPGLSAHMKSGTAAG